MKKLLAFWCLFALVLSCNRKSDLPGSVYGLIEENPDSVLTILANIDREDLSDKGLAEYSLAYTWALDKSGIDVENDSLIGKAYAYFSSDSNSVLYPRCMYYTGKYYSLVDSTEIAESCFRKAIESARRQHDIKVECLASEKYSKLLLFHDTQQAEDLAGKAVSLYSTLEHPDTTNLVYYLLNECVCMTHNGNLDKALQVCGKASALAEAHGDSVLMSAVHTDYAFIYSRMKKYEEAIDHAKKSLCLNPTDSVNAMLSLSKAYINADSINEAKSLLINMTSLSPLQQYTKFYRLLKIAAKEDDAQAAMQYADSALNRLEEMYISELQAKDHYYNTAIQSERKAMMAESESSMKSHLIALISILSIITIAFASYIIYSSKKAARREMEFTRRLHNEEISYKEKQIEVMRNFLLKKIDIAERIEDIRKTTDKHILLTDDDWREIEVFLETVDGLFVSRLKERFPLLDEKDIQLLMLLRLKLPAKSLAMIYGISEKSIKQKLFVYKSKIGLEDQNTSLRSFIESL